MRGFQWDLIGLLVIVFALDAFVLRSSIGFFARFIPWS